MTKLISIQIFLLGSLLSFGQDYNNLPSTNEIFKKQIKSISTNQRIDADSTYNILSNWNDYPAIKDTKKWYLFLYKDSTFGTIPLKIYIPETYQSTAPSQAILILHGAVTISSFKDAYKDTISDEDIFYNYFTKQNFIVIRPFADSYGPHADGTINFDWVVNRANRINKSRNKTNRTFSTLNNIVTQLKEVLNINDNKVFVLGHSDGADGTFALEVHEPSLFAGFVVYNSMLTTIFGHDSYLRNTVNRPLYLVHSSLDDLRPIEQARLIVNLLDSLNSPFLYKEYIGYQHYDKHLPIDLPYSYQWMEGISRNPFQRNITWEMSDTTYSTCDWLHITQFDTTLASSRWQTILDMKTYNKRDKIYIDYPYFDLNKSVAVKAEYNNNKFSIQASRVKEIQLFISPVMVDLQNHVIVKVNGREVFNEKITADKAFLLKNFNTTFDRRALWISSIKVKTN